MSPCEPCGAISSGCAVVANVPRAAGWLRPLDAHTTELRSGAKHPETAAWWLSRFDCEFTLQGDQAVREAVTRIAGRLSRAVEER